MRRIPYQVNSPVLYEAFDTLRCRKIEVKAHANCEDIKPGEIGSPNGMVFFVCGDDYGWIQADRVARSKPNQGASNES